MGIPSYYKRLVDRFPKLVQKGIRQMKSDVLLMDFNCLIYQCVRSDTLPRYTTEGREEWERALIEAVKKYTVNVWQVAGKPAQVLIAVDGVVPMAKIRQQRLRRFKSRWMAGIEREAGIRKAGEEVWDTNAITPGTEFMEKLGVGLRTLAAARGWAVSCAAEAGEGEQKVMAWVRRNKLGGKSVVVYGLDADLIVLSLLAVARDAPDVAGWHLLRELAEFEGGRADGGAFGSLNIRELLQILVPSAFTPAEYMLEYACAMSFLGNDFLPHSLSVKMREGGHDLMCRTLADIHTGGGRLIGADEKVQPATVLDLVRRWAPYEEQWIAENFDHKYKTRPMAPRNDRERLMIPYERLPLEWREESAIWTPTGLLPGWREEYGRIWLHGAAPEQTVGQYMTGLQWIIDYYLGRPVSYSWYFPWNVPPLWGDLEGVLRKGLTVVAAPVTPPVAPQEQLAMVLPMDSWWLVRDSGLRGTPERLPAYWPKRFGFFSVGRRWLWECEAEVPILTATRLRAA